MFCTAPPTTISLVVPLSVSAIGINPLASKTPYFISIDIWVRFPRTGILVKMWSFFSTAERCS